jgi:transposase
MNEVVEIIYQWHQGAGIKTIRRSLGFDRKTIRKYLHLAQEAGVARGEPFPDEADLVQRLQNLKNTGLLRATPRQDVLKPHQDWFEELLSQKSMTAKQVWRLFQEKTGLEIGYCTVKRYLRNELQFGHRPVTVRLEVAPGSQAQVDFGYVGLMLDPASGKRRRTWAFIMTLSYSRHRFVHFVFRQDTATWIYCHILAFEFFGGVPATIVLDNLKSGVIDPDIYDPTLNRAYGELERYYGFVADPAKVRKPQHKGKVERTVPVVRQHLLAGREFADITAANERARQWCRHEIGMAIHGTTRRRPWEVFQTEEAPCLKGLPQEPFDSPRWQKCKVHIDHHLVFDQSYYSVPTRYIGGEVDVRGDFRLVRIFLDGILIKTHPRAERPGTWQTDRSDYPPEKLAYLQRDPAYCRQQAQEIGPHTENLINQLLEQPTMVRIRKAQAILRLAIKHRPEALEEAVGQALAFGNLEFASIKTILEKGVGPAPAAMPLTIPLLSDLGQSFLRPADYYALNQEVRR